MKKLIVFLFFISSLSVLAETDLGRMFYTTSVDFSAPLYSYWGSIKKDKDDILDELIVSRFEKKENLSCSYFRDLSFDKNVRFTYWDYSKATFILQEPCKSNLSYKRGGIAWVLGEVSTTGFISVFDYAYEENQVAILKVDKINLSKIVRLTDNNLDYFSELSLRLGLN